MDLEPMASAKRIEVEKFAERKAAHANAPVQDYSQPGDQAELKPVRDFLTTMSDKLDGTTECDMLEFRNNNCRDRFFIKLPDGADAGATTLISESFDPPKLDVTVGADSIGAARHWEWLREDGKWMKFGEAVQAQLNGALKAGEQGGSITFALGQNSYKVDFTILTGTGELQDAQAYTEPGPGGHPVGTPWWAVRGFQTNTTTNVERPVRLCDSSCLLGVEQWYKRIPTTGATPATMADLKPLKDFKMKPQPGDDGVLRWQHGQNGFAFLLSETLTQMPADYFDKDTDWEPMITAVLMEVAEVIGPEDWPNDLGFERFDAFSKEVLSSGLQADHPPGVCIKSMKEFMKEHRQRSKALVKCRGEVGEKVALMKEKLQKLEDLEELNRTIDDYEFADEGSDEQMQIAPKLKGLLQSFDYSDGLDDPDGLRAAIEDFQDGSAVTASRIDDELLAARIALMRVLAKLAASVQDRVATMETMLPEVERRAAKIQTDSADLCNILQTRSEEAQVTVDETKKEAEQTRHNMMRFEDERTTRRRQYESELNGLHDENEILMNEIREKMNKLYANEVQIRRKTMLDKGDEASHQKKIAECEQNLATLAGCQDEMEKFVVMLDKTKEATQQVAKCADMMLVAHPKSIANNIKKDIEQTQHVGREHDTMHFDTYCAAWSKTLEDETYVRAEKADIEAKIDQTKSDFISARRGKNEEKIRQLKDQKRALVEQNTRQNEKLTKFAHQMTAMHECKDQVHKPVDDAEACYCITPVLERLGRLQAGLCHPVTAHKPWYTLDSDDAFLARIMPHVTHNCSTHCYDAQSKLIEDLDGLTGQNGQPKHADGAVSLPPLDPRPELRRTVMLNAMQVIAQDVDRDAKAAAEALAKKKEAIRQMMPGIKLLDDRPAAGGAAGGADPGAMSRTASRKKKAVVAVLQHAEGVPPG